VVSFTPLPLSPQGRNPQCLAVGAAALDEPWPPLQPVSTVRFLNKIIFYTMRLLAPCPTPILEEQGVSLGLDSTL
jgi:hypothetical protein